MPIEPDRMPDLMLPSSTVRAQLSVVNPRLADGRRVESVTWKSTNQETLPLEAIADSTVKDAEGKEVLDEKDGLPLKVFATFANTPLDMGVGIVTVSAEGMNDAIIRVEYSDPPLGHFAIVGVQAAEAPAPAPVRAPAPDESFLARSTARRR